MKLLVALPLAIATFALAGCTNEKVTMGGVPAWIAAGAQIEEEPEPYRPDPAVIHFETETAPLEWKMITDKREYAAPKPKPAQKPKLEPDPLERGREYRIRRLFR